MTYYICSYMYLGLLIQYLFVGLDRQPVSLSPDAATPSVPNITTSSDSCFPQVIEPHTVKKFLMVMSMINQ